MHGHCLMAIQMLTGREVIRTHVFWRLMMKRVLWGVFEQMRRYSSDSHDALEQEGQVALTDIGLVVQATEDCPNEEGVGDAGSREAAVSPPNDGFELRTTSFYEDYLHRGDVEPLASMNFYVYGMHVSCVHVQQIGNRRSSVPEFEFAAHYTKAKYYVQVLHPAPRVPHLHGVTMPTKDKDPEMRAAVHISLLRKHRCLDAACCGQPQAVKHIRKIPSSKRHRVLAASGDIRAVVDATGALAEWKATEAEMQTLADHADVVDTIALREFEVPGAKHKSDTLLYLIESFTDAKRPVARVRKPQRARGKRASQLRGYVLPRFSVRVMTGILDFFGVVVDDGKEQTLIGNPQEHFTTASAVLSLGGSVRRASYGWHAEQLSAAEYVAVVSREVSANLDLMSEARKRPRPAQVQPTGEEHAEDLGLRAEFVEVEGSENSVDMDDLEHVPLGDVLTLAHRLTVKTGGPGKVSASTQRATEFVKQYADKYAQIQRPRPCQREDVKGRIPQTMPLRQSEIHLGLKSQTEMLESRKDKDYKGDAESEDEFISHIPRR
eukprot:s1096_g14.t1